MNRIGLHANESRTEISSVSSFRLCISTCFIVYPSRSRTYISLLRVVSYVLDSFLFLKCLNLLDE